MKDIIIKDKNEFNKLKDMGTTYQRNNKTVIATTVGVSEDADTDEVDSHRVNFVYIE
jgi:hypothetical protein